MPRLGSPKRTGVSRWRPSVPERPSDPVHGPRDREKAVRVVLEVAADGEVLPSDEDPHRYDAEWGGGVPVLIEGARGQPRTDSLPLIVELLSADLPHRHRV